MKVLSSDQFIRDGLKTVSSKPTGEKLIVLAACLAFGILSTCLAVMFSELEFKYLFGVLGALLVFFAAVIVRSNEGLIIGFLVLFALSIPLRINLGFFYRKEHVGGAQGIDISAIHVTILALFILLLYKYWTTRQQPLLEYNGLLLWSHVLFFLTVILSLWNAADRVLSFYEIIRIMVLIAVFFVIMNLREEKYLRILLFFFSVGVFSQAVLAIIQFKTGLALGLKFLGEQAIVGQSLGGMVSRATGTIGHPNNLAYFFEMLLPLTLALLMVEKKKALQVWYFITFTLGLVGILTTLSRAAWITLPISLPLVFFFIMRKKLFQARTVIIISVALAFSILFIYPNFSMIQKRFFYSDEGSARTRLPMNQAAISVIEQFPVTGVGINNFQKVFSTYDLTGGSRILKGDRHVVHNLYLLVGGELGIPGLIAFVGMFFAVFIVALHWATRVDTWQSGVLVGITAGLLAQMIHGLFDPGFKILMNLSTLVYAMFGIVGAISIMGRRNARSAA